MSLFAFDESSVLEYNMVEYLYYQIFDESSVLEYSRISELSDILPEHTNPGVCVEGICNLTSRGSANNITLIKEDVVDASLIKQGRQGETRGSLG